VATRLLDEDSPLPGRESAPEVEQRQHESDGTQAASGESERQAR